MKILLIEDEFYFRQALKNMLESSEIDLEICGEARDGIEGLKILTQEQPEIVLADINMPLLDGLSFIEQAKKIEPQIKFVIITGYNSFEYAKKAISLGVCNYLLKPIEQEELFDTLQTLMSEIYCERKKEQELKALREFTIDAGRVQRKVLLHDLFMGDREFGGKHQTEQMSRCGIEFSRDICSAACIMNREEEIVFSPSDEEIETAESLTKEYIEKIGSSVVLYVSLESTGNIGLVLNFDERENWKDEIENIIQAFIGNLERKKAKLLYGVGSCYKGIQKIYLSYLEAQQVCYQQKFYNGASRFFERGINRETHIFTEEKRLLLTAYQNIGNYQKIEALIKELQKEALTLCFSRSHLMLLAVELLNPCFSYAQKNEQSEILQEYFEFLVRKLQNKHTTEQIFEYVLAAYSASIQERTNDVSKKSDVIARTLEYIHENYTDCELVIDQIAKAVYANASYLCCVFKKEVGITINKYILQIRLMSAKEKIESGEGYIKQIALECGFANESYFGKCFKNEFMMTPSEYIRIINERQKN